MPAALPPTDGWYWTSMFIAATLGTVIGDLTSFGSGPGLGWSSVLLSAITVAWLGLGREALRITAVYWLTIVLIRTAGTAVGRLPRRARRAWIVHQYRRDGRSVRGHSSHLDAPEAVTVTVAPVC